LGEPRANKYHRATAGMDGLKEISADTRQQPSTGSPPSPPRANGDNRRLGSISEYGKYSTASSEAANLSASSKRLSPGRRRTDLVTRPCWVVGGVQRGAVHRSPKWGIDEWCSRCGCLRVPPWLRFKSSPGDPVESPCCLLCGMLGPRSRVPRLAVRAGG